MNDVTRAAALVLSVVLWAPVAPVLLRGDVSAEKAILLYLAAFALALGGCTALARMVAAYAPEPVPEPEAARGSALDEPGELELTGRRTGDR